MAKIDIFTMEALMNVEFKKDVLIKHWLHRGECLFVKAKKKVGKSIFAQNLAHCASSGDSLFGDDTYVVPKPLKVAYLFSEGTLVDWKERVTNMNKLYPGNTSNLVFFQCNCLKMYDINDRNELMRELDKLNMGFDIIVWDCLYKFLYGRGVNDETAVGMFNANEEYIRNYYNAASVIVHHDSEKEYKDSKGHKYSSASVGNAMGHSFLLAHPTQIYTIEKFIDGKKNPYNKITLGEKRSGDLVEEIIYSNIFPENDEEGRLGMVLCDKEISSNYYAVKEFIQQHKQVLIRNFHNTITEAEDLEFSRETTRRIINKLIKAKEIERIEIDGKKYFQSLRSS